MIAIYIIPEMSEQVQFYDDLEVESEMFNFVLHTKFIFTFKGEIQYHSVTLSYYYYLYS